MENPRSHPAVDAGRAAMSMSVDLHLHSPHMACVVQ